MLFSNLHIFMETFEPSPYLRDVAKCLLNAESMFITDPRQS